LLLLASLHNTIAYYIGTLKIKKKFKKIDGSNSQESAPSCALECPSVGYIKIPDMGEVYV